MKKTVFLILFICFILKLSAQQVNIIPQPLEMNLGDVKENFMLRNNTIIYTNDTLCNPSISFLIHYVQTNYGIKLIQKAKLASTDQNVINLYCQLRVHNQHSNWKEQYSVDVIKNGIKVRAETPTGIFYGIQTLIQLLPTTKTAMLKIPSVSIIDEPRFQYRGMHLDVSRHFFDVTFVKKYIDYLALHKMNYFHWHLTDDHGWRIEIKKYPKLTEIGAWRNGSIIGLWPGKGNENIKYEVLPAEIKITPKDAIIKTDNIRHGGFYTQEEIKDVISYAAKRYVTIIPEIEMPAHSMALLAAYP
jgi:hexosaminidase